jgi:hypothetical protein
MFFTPSKKGEVGDMKNLSFLRTAFIVLFLISLSLTGLAKDEQVNSLWTDVPLKIDGSEADWTNQTFNYEKKVDVDYAFRNDAEYLYVLFVFKDQKYMSSIMQTGMTIYFHTEGKKKKDFGITFTSQPVTADQFIAFLEKQQGPLSEERKAQIKANPRYFIQKYKVINKKEEMSSTDTPAQAKKVVFRSSSDRNEQMAVHEFAIPLARVSPLAPGIGAEPGKTIKLCFEWGGMTKEMKEQGMKQLGDQTTRTTATKAGDLTEERQDAGGSSPSLSSIRQRGPKKYEFWVDVQLDKKK